MLQSKQKPQNILNRKPCSAGMCLSPVDCRTETEGGDRGGGGEREEGAWERKKGGRGKKTPMRTHPSASLAAH